VSDFATRMTAARPRLQAKFGEAATYTATGGVATPITVEGWMEDSTRRERLERGENRARSAFVTIRTAVLADPVKGAILNRTSTGEDWTIAEAAPRSGAHFCRVERTEAISAEGSTYRNR